jgi:hypothetical protein
MKTEGAREVARAFREGRCLTKGNARTDGTTYYLFGNPIARIGSHDTVEQVKSRLVGGNDKLLHLSWAGWVTKSTERHLNTILEVFWRRPCAWCAHPHANPTPHWTRDVADDIEADPHRWYPITELVA